MAKYVTDEVKKQIGMTGEPRTVEIERGAMRRFGGMIAMPTFFRSLGTAVPEVKLNMPQYRGLDGGSDWEYFEPVRPGDRITVQSKLADLRESEGRLGTMVFITAETSYTNQHGVVCAIQRSTGIRY